MRLIARLAADSLTAPDRKRTIPKSDQGGERTLAEMEAVVDRCEEIANIRGCPVSIPN